MEITDKDKERYWKKVDRGGPDECWKWLASRDTYGYGHIWIDGALRKAVWPGSSSTGRKLERHTCSTYATTLPV